MLDKAKTPGFTDRSACKAFLERIEGVAGVESKGKYAGGETPPDHFLIRQSSRDITVVLFADSDWWEFVAYGLPEFSLLRLSKQIYHLLSAVYAGAPPVVAKQILDGTRTVDKFGHVFGQKSAAQPQTNGHQNGHAKTRSGPTHYFRASTSEAYKAFIRCVPKGPTADLEEIPAEWLSQFDGQAGEYLGVFNRLKVLTPHGDGYRFTRVQFVVNDHDGWISVSPNGAASTPEQEVPVSPEPVITTEPIDDEEPDIESVVDPEPEDEPEVEDEEAAEVQAEDVPEVRPEERPSTIPVMVPAVVIDHDAPFEEHLLFFEQHQDLIPLLEQFEQMTASLEQEVFLGALGHWRALQQRNTVPAIRDGEVVFRRVPAKP